MLMSSPLRKRFLLALAVAAIVILGWWAWQKVSRPWGAQHVAFTPAIQQCDQVGSLRYCVNRAEGGVNGDVVYHLHGRNLEAAIWNDPTYFTALLQHHWQRAGDAPPTVISLSYGPVWLLTPKGEAPRSGLLNTIVADIASIEGRMGTPRRRILLGESMGGLNSLILGLSHAHNFNKVAALCPNVYQESPFATWRQIREAMVRTGADPRVALGIWRLAQDYVANEAEWRRMSPLALIEQVATEAARPDLYLSAGLYDRYGLFEGSERLARRATQRGLQAEWHPLYGGHCAIDIASLGAFLVR